MNAFARIRGELEAITDPVSQLRACDEVYEQAKELISFTGANGLRGRAAQAAVKTLGLAEAVRQTGYTRATLKRVAGQ